MSAVEVTFEEIPFVYVGLHKKSFSTAQKTGQERQQELSGHGAFYRIVHFNGA